MSGEKCISKCIDDFRLGGDSRLIDSCMSVTTKNKMYGTESEV